MNRTKLDRMRHRAVTALERADCKPGCISDHSAGNLLHNYLLKSNHPFGDAPTEPPVPLEVPADAPTVVGIPKHIKTYIRDQLAGHDLACWCPPDQPCHADLLLEIANAGDRP